MEQVERLIADRVFAGSGIPDLLSSDIFQNIGGIPKGAELAPCYGLVRDCIKHGGDQTTDSGIARCFRKSGCHSRNRSSSRLLRTAQLTCNKRWAPSADQRIGWHLPIL